MYRFNFAAAAATFAVVLAVQSASAGAPPHRMPAERSQTQPVYQLKVDGAPAMGQPLVITLVNQADGKAVRDGTVSVMRPVFLGIKASPMIQYIPVNLTRNADGNFVCSGEHHVPGARLTLRGTGPDSTSPVWLTLAVHS